VKDVLLAMPPGVVIVIKPFVAPSGTLAYMAGGIMLAYTVNDAAGWPLNKTLEHPAKPVPVIVTSCPSRAAGVIVAIVGNGMTVKTFALIAVPPGVVNVITPVVAPMGTVTVTEVALITLMVADVPLN